MSSARIGERAIPTAPPPAPDAGAAVTLALADLAHRHGLQVVLGDRQRAVVAALIAHPFGQRRAEVYLGLAAAGVHLSPGADAAAHARFDAVLGLAGRVWAGGAGSLVPGATPLARLEALAARVREEARGAARLDDGAVARLSAWVTAGTAKVVDVFAGSGPLPALREAGAWSPDLVVPGGLTGAPARRIGAASSAAGGSALPVDMIIDGPGAKPEPWSAAGVARRLHEGVQGGRLDHDRALDLTFGLNLDDRLDIGVAFVRFAAADGDTSARDLLAAHDAAVKAAAQDPAKGRAALDAARRRVYARFTQAMARACDGPMGETRPGLLMRAQLDPDNVTGEPQADDIILLDLHGLLGKNGEAVQRVLMTSSTERLRAIDERMRAKHQLSLEDAVKKLSGADERRALFLLHAPRVGGRVPVEHVRAFELAEAARGGDRERLFRALETLSEADLRATAGAFAALYPGEGRPGGAGASGDLRESALYHFLYEKLGGLFSGGGDRRRLGLALGAWPPARAGDAAGAPRVAGLRWQPTGKSEVDQVLEPLHRQLVARYMAACKGETAPFFAFVKPDVEVDVRDGRPTFAEVEAAYDALATDAAFGRRNFQLDLEHHAGRTNAELVAMVKGNRLSPAAKAALELKDALDGGFLGLRGTREDVVARVLDAPAVALTAAERQRFVADRQRFLAQVRAEYARLAGGGADALRHDLAEAFGEQVRVTGGGTLPTRALALEARGFLTPAERLVYALNQPGSLGVFGKTDADEVVGVLAALSPIEKVAALTEYAALTGRVFALGAGGNPLQGDVRRLRGHDAPFVAQLAEILPQDEAELALFLEAYLGGQTDPVVAAWIRNHLGDADEWLARNFPDQDPVTPGVQSRGLEHLRELVRKAGGAEAFAAAVHVPEQQLAAELRKLVVDTRGHAVSRMLMDFLGPEGEGLRNAGDTVEAAVREYALLMSGDHSPADERAATDRIQAGYAELCSRLSQYERLRGQRVELVANVAVTVALGAALVAAPQISPALLAAIGAGTGAGVSYAFDAQGTTIVRNALRGGAAGLLAWVGSAQLASVPPEVSTWLRAFRGGVAAVELGAGRRAVDVATTDATWRAGLWRGAKTIVEGTWQPGAAAADFATGYVLTAVADLVRQQLDNGQPPATSEPPGSGGDSGGDPGPGGPGSTTNPPGGTPGGTGNPGGPGSTTNPPGGVPGGTGNSGGPGSTTNPPGGVPGGTGTPPPPPPGGAAGPGTSTPPPGTGGAPGGPGTSPAPGGVPGGGSAPTGPGSTTTPPAGLPGGATPTPGGGSSGGSVQSGPGSTTTPPAGLPGGTTPAPGGVVAAPGPGGASSAPGGTGTPGGPGSSSPPPAGVPGGTSAPIGVKPSPLRLASAAAVQADAGSPGATDVARATVEASARAFSALALSPTAAGLGEQTRAAVLRGLVAVEAHARELVPASAAELPTRREASGFLARARKAGLIVPSEPPVSAREWARLLADLRRQVTDRGGEGGVPPGSADRRAPEAPASTRVGAVDGDPLLAGSRPEWIRRYLRMNAEYLLGRKDGSLAAASPATLVQDLRARLGGETHDLEQVIRAEQICLLAFGLHEPIGRPVDGAAGPRTRAAFERYVVLFGRAVRADGKLTPADRQTLRAKLPEHAQKLRRIAAALGRDDAWLGTATLADLRQLVADYARGLNRAAGRRLHREDGLVDASLPTP